MNKRKNEELGDGIDDQDKVQSLKAKRVKGKERVTFADTHRTREFNVDAELEDNQIDELVEGDRITRVRGEEEQQQWSDDEIEVEPFNLKSENQEGYFDRNGNYVENKMDKGVEDAWLDEYDEKWAKKMNSNIKSRKAMDEDEKEVVHDKVALLKTVIELLQPKESATAALKRLGGTGKTATTKKNNNNNVGKGAKEGGKDMTQFYKLTDAIDALLHGGDKKEQVQEELDTELATQASSSSSNQVMWEYKGQDGAIFGPYTSANMREWRAQGYFTGESAVPIRKVSDTKEEEDIFASSSGDNEFVSSDSIDFSQYP